MNILFRLILAPGDWAQITYKMMYKLWIMLWYSFLDASKCESERERDEEMVAIEGNRSYD